MDDLLKALRTPVSGWPGDAECVDAETAERAAAEIERLTAALKPLAMYRLYGHDVSEAEWDRVPEVLGLSYDHRITMGNFEQRGDGDGA